MLRERVHRRSLMRPELLVFLVLASLWGCGAETATTAATGAAIKQKEIEEGKRMQEQARKQIEESMQQTERRAGKDHER